MKKFLLTTAAAGFVLFAGANARADLISIGLSSDGTSVTTVNTSTTGSAGIIGVNFGGFNVNTVTATGTPVLTEPTLQTTSVDVQHANNGGNVLYVFVTEQNLTSPLGVSEFESAFTSNSFTGDVTSVVEKTLIDTSNGLYTGSVLSSTTFTGLGSTSSVNLTPSIAGPYSETVEYIITTSGAGSVNDTINIRSVPEPISLTLLGSGLLGLGLVRRRSR
jgi:hypothetical protein